MLKAFAILVGTAMVLFSFSSLVAYAWDKRQARKEGQRIPEAQLHLLSLLGGWPGALIGQRWCRHKTQKKSFLLVFWSTVCMHLLIVVAIAYYLMQWTSSSE